MDKVIMVIGPTGVGKSEIGIRLAKKLGTEIISADSIQVYRRLDIGSAKVLPEEAEGVTQHLIDILDPDQNYSVYDFQKASRKIAAELIEEKKVPVVVGGTGLYTKAMVYDYVFENEDEPSDYIHAKEGIPEQELYEELKKLDPIAAEGIHPHNRKRVLRALWMAEKGTRKSDLISSQKHELIYDTFFIELTMPRKKLLERIGMRVDKMVKAGLREEIEGLRKDYPDLWSFQSMAGIGYKEWKGYFEGTLTLEETLELIKKNTRQFVKRQYTWFRHQMPQNWYDVTNEDDMKRMERELEEWMNTHE